MNISYFQNYESMSSYGSSLVIEGTNEKRALQLCTATGYSPAGLYSNLKIKADRDRSFFNQLRIIKLDEWGGVPENHPVTCEYYLRTKVLEPLGIPQDRFLSFQSNSLDPQNECSRIEKELSARGPIDICILGLGKNGHLGFNEPASQLEPYCHVAQLTDHSLQHEMVQSMKVKPGYGLTLGMENILSAKRIILLITGAEKDQVYRQLLEGKVTTNLPASFLWLHNRVDCLVDESAINNRTE